MSDDPKRGVARYWTPLRLLASTALVAVVVSRVDWTVFGFHLRQGDPTWLAAAAGLVAIDRTFMAVKWGYLLGALGRRPPLLELLRTYLLTGLAGTAMQWQLGGDLARIGAVGRRLGSTSAAAASVVIERGTGLCALGLLATAALAALSLRHDLGPPGIAVAPLLAVTSAAWLAPPLLLLPSVRRTVRRTATRALPARLRDALASIEAATRIERVRRVLPLFALATLLEQTAPVWILSLLARSFSVPVPIADVACTIPLIAFVSRMPFSLDFVGVREGLYVLLLGIVGVSSGAALLLALVARVLDVAVLGLGVLALAWLPQAAGPRAGEAR